MLVLISGTQPRHYLASVGGRRCCSSPGCSSFGGNLTAIGASANVVVLGIAMRAGTPISFWEFTRKGAVVTAILIVLAAPYLWLRYFVFS